MLEKMRKGFCFVLICIMLLTSVPGIAFAAETEEFVTYSTDNLPFIDITGHWAYDAIRFMFERGLMQGTSSTMFEPDIAFSRAMAATLLHRIAGEVVPAFIDVAPGQWYSQAIAWAYENDIVQGVGDERFDPTANVTREEMATMLYRFAVFQGYVVNDPSDAALAPSANLRDFPDADLISAWAEVAMRWAVHNGLMVGTNLGELNPQGNTTRAEAATLLMRFIEQFTFPHFPITESDSTHTGTLVPFAVGANREVHSVSDPFFITIANSLFQLEYIYANDSTADEANYIYGYTGAFFNEKAIVVIALMENSGAFGHDIELVRNGEVLGVNIRRSVPGTIRYEGMWWYIDGSGPTSLPDNIAERRILLEVSREDIAGITSIEYFRHCVSEFQEPQVCPGCGDEQIIWRPRPGSAFEDDAVAIVLTHCVSTRDNRDWILEDFGNISGALYLRDVSRLSDEQWELIQAGRWRETMVNWPEFRRSVLIRLDQNCKENVARVIQQLRQHDFIYWVGPIFIPTPA